MANKTKTLIVDPIDPDSVSDVEGDGIALGELCERLGFGEVDNVEAEGDYDQGWVRGHIVLKVAADKADALRQAVRAEGYEVWR
jgi:hypothetical protein